MWWKQGDGSGSGSHPTQRNRIKIHRVHCCFRIPPPRSSPLPVNISKQVRAGPSLFFAFLRLLYTKSLRAAYSDSLCWQLPLQIISPCASVYIFFFPFPFLHPLSNSISLSFPRELRRQGPVKMQRDWQQQNSINSSTAVAARPV